MERPDLQRIRHILVYCEEISELAARFGKEEEIFLRDNAYYLAVTMCILQIGELVGGLTESFKQETENRVLWTKIRGMRNIMAHQYSTVRKERIWVTVWRDIPVLAAFCEEILAEGGCT